MILLVLCGVPGAHAQQPFARITAAVNVVNARNGITGRVIVGYVGVALVDGDSVMTGGRSAAAITFPNGTVLRLGEFSQVTVHPGVVQVGQGSVDGRFRGPGRLNGRYAIAAVRGTRVLMAVTGHGDEVACYPDGPGTHDVDVVRAGTAVISGTVNRVQGLTIQSDALVGQDQNWVGAAYRTSTPEGALEQVTVAAFDPAAGTITLQQPPAAPIAVGDAFTLVNPPNTPVTTLRPGFQTIVPIEPNRPPTAPRPTPNPSFPMGQEFPTTNALVSGANVDTYLGSSITQAQREQIFELQREQDANTSTGLVAPGVQVQQMQAPPSGGGIGVTVPGSQGQGDVLVTVGRTARSRSYSNVFVNRPVFAGTGFGGQDQSSGLGYLQESAVFGDLFFRISGRAGTLGGQTQTALDEALVHYRHPGFGDLQAGRFHWFPSPVINNPIGRLLDFDTADGLLYRLPLPGPVAIDGAYFPRINPLAGPVVSGYALHAAAFVLGSHVGASTLWDSLSPGNTGFSLDAAVPVLLHKVELYGEGGRDPASNGFYTGGVYLPYLFRRFRTDVYLEYSYRQRFGEEYGLSTYFPVATHVTGLVSLNKLGGADWRPGLGVQARY